jgi:hypothetical protein
MDSLLSTSTPTMGLPAESAEQQPFPAKELSHSSFRIPSLLAALPGRRRPLEWHSTIPYKLSPQCISKQPLHGGAVPPRARIIM